MIGTSTNTQSLALPPLCLCLLYSPTASSCTCSPCRMQVIKVIKISSVLEGPACCAAPPVSLSAIAHIPYPFHSRPVAWIKIGSQLICGRVPIIRLIASLGSAAAAASC